MNTNKDMSIHMDTLTACCSPIQPYIDFWFMNQGTIKALVAATDNVIKASQLSALSCCRL